MRLKAFETLARAEFPSVPSAYGIFLLDIFAEIVLAFLFSEIHYSESEFLVLLHIW